MGEGHFVASKTLDVRLNGGGTRVLKGDQIFLNLERTRQFRSVPGLEAAGPLTNIEALELDHVPEHLIVLGGGYVGLELAQAFRRFGSRVTIIEQGPQLSRREDPDVAEEMRRSSAAKALKFLSRPRSPCAGPLRAEASAFSCARRSGEQTIEGSDILVAAGRTPNTAGIGLDVAGVELDGAAISESTSGWRPVLPTSGRSANVPAARSSRTYPIDDFRIIRDNLAGGTAPRATGWSPTACLPIRRWRGSA